MPEVIVQVDGQRYPGARVYKAGFGALLVKLSDNPELYVIRLTKKELGATSGHYFWFINEWGALAKDRPDPSVDVSAAKMNRHEPLLSIAVQNATFRAPSGHLVMVAWSE